MKRICKYCGAEYDGDPNVSCCPSCAEQRRKTTLATRVCRQCGVSFPGGPRAWYCPDCRAERQREADRRVKRNGPRRKLGSTDYCVVCGKPYVVESGLQKYCPDCAEEAVREIDRAQSREWNRKNTTPEQRRKERQDGTAFIPCAVCGKLFQPDTRTVTCSPECREVFKKENAAAWEERRKEYRNQYRRNLRKGEKLMPKLVTNVVKRPYTFALTFADGRTETVTVEAESPDAAVLRLPQPIVSGEYKWKLIEQEEEHNG